MDNGIPNESKNPWQIIGLLKKKTREDVEHQMQHSEDNQINVVIVGGGLSGLQAAHYLIQQGCNVFLIEKEDVIGYILS